MQAYYPSFDPTVFQTLSIVARLAAEDPDYLPNSPYPPDFQQLMARLSAPNPASQSLHDFTDRLDSESVNIEKEAEKLYLDLKAFASTVSAMDVSEKVATFRVAAGLMEKLITFRERASAVAQYEAFKAMVLDAIDRYLTPQQKSLVMADLKRLENL